MARSTPYVTFAPEVRASRRLRDDEVAVCRAWSNHAARCDRCTDPVDVWRRSNRLCDRGRSYAVDVAQYIYSKGTRPYSVIDKSTYGQRVELEIPREYSAVRELIRAFDKGLTVHSGSRPVISHDSTYYIPSRNERYVQIPTSRTERYHDGHRRRSKYYDDDYHGSLYYADEQARRRRSSYIDEPVIVISGNSRRSSGYYH